MNHEFITISEIVVLLRLSRPTVRKRLRQGEIAGLTDHYGYPRVNRQAFEKWHNSRDRGKR